MNDDFPKNNTSATPTPQVQPAQPPSGATPLAVKRRRNKKALLIALSAIVIVLFGGYYAWTVTTPKKVTYDYGTARKIPQFYLVSDTTSIRSFDPTTKKLSSNTIEVGEKEQFIRGSNYTNQFLQISPDRNTTVYLTGEYNYDVSNSHDGVRGPIGRFVYAIKGGGEAKQVMSAAEISDWILSTDGSMIYYLTQGDPYPDFHVMSLDNGKDILIEKDIFSNSAGKKETPMLLTDDGSVRMYVSYENGIREYRYEDTFVTSKRLAMTECKGCKVASGSPLSPDGKSLVLSGIEQTGEASLNILDLTNGRIKQVKRTDKISDQFYRIYWSPDGTSIVYSVGPYGSDADHKIGYLNRFEIYNVKTKVFTTGFSDPSSGIYDQDFTKHSVGVLGWSPDGSVIMFYNGGKVKMYTVISRQVTDTGLEYEWWKNPALASGWYTLWRVTEKIK